MKMPIRLSQLSLRAKLMIAFILAALIPLSILSAITTRQLTQLIEKETQGELTSAAMQTAQNIDTFISEQLDSIYIEAQLPDFRTYLELPVAERSDSREEANASTALNVLKRKKTTLIRSYALLDANGINLLDTNSANIGVDEKSNDYFRVSASSGLRYMSDVIFTESGPSLFFSSPVWGERGLLLGIVRLEYSAQIIQDVLMTSANQFQAPELYAVLVDEDYGIRLAHSRDYGLVYKTYAILDDAKAAQIQSLGRLPAGSVAELSTNQAEFANWLNNWQETPFFTSESISASEAPAISTVAALKKAPWLLITRQSVDVANLPIQEQRGFSLVLSVLVAIVMGGIAIGATQLLAAPITRLKKVAEKVAEGDLSVRAHVETDDEIGALAQTFNTMTDELQRTLLDLENRVADRTRAIELSADISRRLSIILGPAQLVAEVVELIQSTFDYYHVQIYLYDESGNNLAMMGGTGDVGRTMLRYGHQLAKGQGLVGKACDIGAMVLVADTQKDPNWLANPLLPETRSEIAVPIMMGNQVLGALDVQENRVDGLAQQDADLLAAIANQVAIALRNARQFSKAEKQAERQAQVNRIIQQIQSTQTIENALQVAVREIGKVMDAPRTAASIRLSRSRQDDSPAAT